MPLKHHDFTAIWHQIGAKGRAAPIPCGAPFQAHLDFAKLPLRNCFVIDPKAPSTSPPYGASAGRASEPAEHDTTHRCVDHSHRGLRQTLVVLGQPTRLP